MNGKVINNRIAESDYFGRSFPVPENREKGLNIISGNGTIVLHDSSIDVDISVRVSDLLKTITNLSERITVLEGMVGVDLEEGEEVAPIEEIRLGIWRLRGSGTKLLKEVDLNSGLTVTPNWEIRGEDDL